MSNTDDAATAAPMNAYEILFSYEIKQPGSITIPGFSQEDAEKRLRAFFDPAAYRNLTIESVTNVEDAPTFKRMVAQHMMSLQQEQELYEQWLVKATTANEILATPTNDDELPKPPTIN